MCAQSRTHSDQANNAWPLSSALAEKHRIMEEMNLESYTNNNVEIDEYLSEAITNYGIEQLQGNKPFKLYSCYKSNTGKIIGAVMGSVTTNLFFISHIYVEETNRNKGIGKILMSAIEQSAIESGCNIIRLNTFNKNSHAFYINSGFTKTICIKGYMNDFDLVYYHKTIS